MGIFSDIEDYTVDELHKVVTTLYSNAVQQYAGHGTPKQVREMAEWQATCEFRKMMRIKQHTVHVPKAMIPKSLLDKLAARGHMHDVVGYVAPKRVAAKRVAMRPVYPHLEFAAPAPVNGQPMYNHIPVFEEVVVLDENNPF